jgi:hypothetical protein
VNCRLLAGHDRVRSWMKGTCWVTWWSRTIRSVRQAGRCFCQRMAQSHPHPMHPKGGFPKRRHCRCCCCCSVGPAKTWRQRRSQAERTGATIDLDRSAFGVDGTSRARSPRAQSSRTLYCPGSSWLPGRVVAARQLYGRGASANFQTNERMEGNGKRRVDSLAAATCSSTTARRLPPQPFRRSCESKGTCNISVRTIRESSRTSIVDPPSINERALTLHSNYSNYYCSWFTVLPCSA